MEQYFIAFLRDFLASVITADQLLGISYDRQQGSSFSLEASSKHLPVLSSTYKQLDHTQPIQIAGAQLNGK